MRMLKLKREPKMLDPFDGSSRWPMPPPSERLQCFMQPPQLSRHSGQ
jgi:hypothetical protein